MLPTTDHSEHHKRQKRELLRRWIRALEILGVFDEVEDWLRAAKESPHHATDHAQTYHPPACTEGHCAYCVRRKSILR